MHEYVIPQRGKSISNVIFIADTFHDWRISHDVGNVKSLLLFVPPWLPFGLGENFFCFIVSRVSMRPELRMNQFMNLKR